MRTLLVLLAMTGVASAEPLWDAELRLGYGFEMIGGDNMTAAHSAPMTIQGIGAYAFDDDPWLYGYGGFVIEAVDRNSIGSTAGIQLVSGPMRARLGGVYIFAPLSLYGMNASGGACKRMTKSIKACGDLDITEYFAGKDLAEGHAVTQVQLVFGMVIDGT
ncbi:MAG TPA: hypothetical protein VGL61_12810 [Kofleriaceae bacterium]